MHRALYSTCGLLAALMVLMAFAPPASAQAYVFTKVVDSAEDSFSPFSFECSSINNRGDIAFRTARIVPNEPIVTQGIYRANATGATRLTTIAEGRRGFDFLGQMPSINDLGEVAFAASVTGRSGSVESVLRGNGTRLTPIATVEDEFSRVGFEPTVNNSGVVAFKAELDDFDQGLFSGQRRHDHTTHYLASTSDFSEFGPLSRPSINNHGAIAFEALVEGVFAAGIFVTDASEPDGFRTIAEPDPNPNVFIGWPALNDAGTVAFHRTFFDEASGEGGAELVTGNGGPLTVIADTRGPFDSFGFFFGFLPPSINNHGDVAFSADLDSGGRGVFTGPDPVADRVIQTGDTLDGLTVSNLRLCDESLNDAGQLAIQVTLSDASVPDGIRVAIYRVTPA